MRRRAYNHSRRTPVGASPTFEMVFFGVSFNYNTSLEVYMNRIYLVLCALLGVLATGSALSSRVSGTTEVSKARLVNTLRLLNTQEYAYRDKNGRFAPREEMLTFLRMNGILSHSPIDLDNPQPYELIVTTSANGTHYQITLKRPSDMNDKSTWCKPAAFSDDAGVIFLGSALDCAAPTDPKADGK